MEKTAKYQPANGIEGERFMQAFCHVCAKYEEGGCMILGRALSCDVKDDAYPEEWLYTLSKSTKAMLESARCTAFVATLPAMTEENPFEVTEQSEGQNLIDVVEDIERQVEEVAGIGSCEVAPDDGSHQCDSCSLEFATCESKSVQFGIDRYPEATGKEADRVISCGSFLAKHNLADVVAFSPSPLDRYSAKFTKELPVPVPEEELAKYAQEMARIHGTWVKTKLDAKAFAKSCKNVTDECEERELEIAEIINAGTELRPVTVFWSYDFTHHVKRLVRSDTREVVEEVNLEPEDYQTDLPLFDTVEEAQPDEVLKTGTLEGDSGGEEEIEAQGEYLEENEGIESGDDYPTEGDISEGITFTEIIEEIKTEDLDKGWPDPPMRQSADSPVRLIQP